MIADIASPLSLDAPRLSLSPEGRGGSVLLYCIAITPVLCMPLELGG